MLKIDQKETVCGASSKGHIKSTLNRSRRLLAYIFHAYDSTAFEIVNIYYLRSIDLSTPEKSDFLM